MSPTLVSRMAGMIYLFVYKALVDITKYNIVLSGMYFIHVSFRFTNWKTEKILYFV